jgi:hypothetical protein
MDFMDGIKDNNPLITSGLLYGYRIFFDFPLRGMGYEEDQCESQVIMY